MDGVYTMWSRPRGTPELSLLERLLMAASVTQWQALHGRALLYCDSDFAMYLDRLGMLDTFDEVDTAAVDQADSLDLNPRVFWSLARVLSLADARVPFVSLDSDLIVWRDLRPVFAGSSVVITHWESTEPSLWYPPTSALDVPPGFRWKPWMLERTNAANVSLLYLGDEHFRGRYVEEARRFAIGNPARVLPAAGIAPELLFAEQCLLPLTARAEGVDIVSLIQAVWAPALDRFENDDPVMGTWDPLLTGNEQPAGLTHAWFHKAVLQPDDPRLRRLESELVAVLSQTNPTVLDRAARRKGRLT